MKIITLILVLSFNDINTILLGGYRQIAVDNQLVQKLLPSLQAANLASLHIVRVEVQLVNGLNYKVYLQQVDVTGSEICVKIYCSFDNKCSSARSCIQRRSTSTDRVISLLGEQPATQAEAQNAINFAVEHINSQSNNMFRVVTEDVTNVTKQEINGVQYHFTLSLVTTECRNSNENKGKLLEDCQISSNSERQICRVSVLNSLSAVVDDAYTLEELKCGQFQKVVSPHKILFGGDDHDYCYSHLQAFKKFKQQYGRLYTTQEEEATRFKIFCENMKRIKSIQETEKGSAIYGVTKFADLSEDEFRKQYLTPVWDLNTPHPWIKKATIPTGPIPDSFDWRDHNAVTPVKNQGSCGSCWAFSTTGNIEGQWAIQSQKLVSLSEQELVDCDKLDEGCNGGLPSNAYEAIIQLGGIETESDYKYLGKDAKCMFNRSEVAVKIHGAVNISSDENEMAAWLVQNGPISIGINAFAMQFYFGGISHPWKIFCNPKSLDHGVLIVGYGVKNGEPYWIIKNSWGSDWGEKGYYLVYRGSGVCGLNTMCTSATI